jgi:tetratricopeptide (TPR) repeat protein
VGSGEKKGLFKAGEGSLTMKMKWMKVFGFAAVLALAPQAGGAAGPLPVEADHSARAPSTLASGCAREGPEPTGDSPHRRVLVSEPANTQAQPFTRTLSWKGEYERAISIYGEVIKREPMNAEAHAGYARVLSWKGEYGLSVQEFRRALEIEPGSIETRTSLARTLWWKGESRAALKELSRVLSKEPGYLDALNLERSLRQDNGPSLKASCANCPIQTRRHGSLRLSFADTFGFTNHRFGRYRHYDASIASKSAEAHFDLKDSIRSPAGLFTPGSPSLSLDASSYRRAELLRPVKVWPSLVQPYPLVDTVPSSRTISG